jgi:transcriptional regulator with XRE-family HTH domain
MAALPFCHLRLKTPKPDGRYPAQLQRLGGRIRKRRLDLGLLQKEIGDRLGADTRTVNDWEIGRARPGLRFVPRILTFLGYDPRLKELSLLILSGRRLVDVAGSTPVSRSK